MSHALPLANTFFTTSFLFLLQMRCVESEDTLPHMKGWVDTSLRELRAFLGLRFLMGLQSQRRIRDLWTPDVARDLSETMSHDRIDVFTSALHFADSEADHPADDRLGKLRLCSTS